MIKLYVNKFSEQFSIILLTILFDQQLIDLFKKNEKTLLASSTNK